MISATLNGIRCFAFSSRTELIKYIEQHPQLLIAVNAEKILKNDIKLKEIINNNIGYPDGVGALWALKKKGFKQAIKIPGVELWLDIIKYFEHTKSFYFIGSTDEVITRTIEKLKIDFPSIKIINYRNGYINSYEFEDLKQDIIKTKPDIIFVAMGSPKQEFIMQELNNLHKAIYMGLGGSFDVYCDLKKRAPKWMIQLGIEWLYRLIKEPTRIKRQVVLFVFFWKLIFNKL